MHRGFDRFGKEAGGEKKSDGWYRRSDEVVTVVDLQKSQYYVNVAFWLRAVGDERFPKTWKSHITMRIEDLPGVERDRVECLVDLECDVPDERRVDDLSALLTTAVVPFIERGASMGGLRSMIDDGTIKRWLLTVQAQETLGILAG